MANILPQDMQRNVWRSYRARFVLTFSLAALGLALLASLVLLPSALLLHSEQSSTQTSQSSAISQSELAKDKALLARTQFAALQIGPIVSHTNSSIDVVASVIAAKPSGVHIDDISYAPAATSTIIIAGSAANGDEINAYRQTLEKDARFQSVSVPVASLVGSDNGRFTITILGVF